MGGTGKAVGYIGGMRIAVGGTGVDVEDKAVKVGEAEVEVSPGSVGALVAGEFKAIWVSWTTAVKPEDRVDWAAMVCATNV
jgi:hypothetical protein